MAVEVVSPNDRAREVSEKVNRWLAHGARSVWVAHPKKRTTIIHRTGEPPEVFAVHQILSDEPVLPGFRLALSKVFHGL